MSPTPHSFPPLLLLYPSTVSIIIIILLTPTTDGISFYCSANQYANPQLQECYRTLAAFPTADGAYRYFLEPQMRTTFPNFDWPDWVDPRPPDQQQRTVQIPKFWSIGTCNMALLSYVHGSAIKPLSIATWSDIFNTALQLVHNCLVTNQQGGAATVTDAAGLPVSTVFLWANGATFERVLGTYMSAERPVGIDPTRPQLLQTINGTMAGLGDLSNDSAPVAVS